MIRPLYPPHTPPKSASGLIRLRCAHVHALSGRRDMHVEGKTPYCGLGQDEWPTSSAIHQSSIARPFAQQAENHTDTTPCTAHVSRTAWPGPIPPTRNHPSQQGRDHPPPPPTPPARRSREVTPSASSSKSATPPHPVTRVHPALPRMRLSSAHLLLARLRTGVVRKGGRIG
jgi:hypothetical protein